MILTNPQDLSQLLKQFGFYTNKDLGQNFLICEESLQAIIQAANITAADDILEIGPGPGVLTQALIQSPAKSVTALEIDEKVILILKYTTKENSKLTILHQNALEFQPPKSGYILTANIPYYLTSPIFRHFLAHKNPPKRAVVLVQKEVAEKICCKIDDQTILSLQIQMYGKPEIVKIVKKEKFFPAPKVDSAILKIEMFEKPLIPEKLLPLFWSITKQAFNQRRKKIGNTLGKQKVKSGKTFLEIFQKTSIDQDKRPQALTIEEWRKVCESIENSK